MTKIVCTIGPGSESKETLKKMMKAGMNVARLNFSHGSHKYHKTLISRLRSVSEKLELPVSILQDLAGPKIRIGEIKEGPIALEYGSVFILTERSVPGDKNEVSLSHKDLLAVVGAGDKILLSDGSIELKVIEVSGLDIVTKVIVGGELSSKKGVSFPESTINISAFTDKDKIDLEFGIKNGVDLCALSFVKDEKDIHKVREFMKNNKAELPIIAKIEKHEALGNIDRILDSADGIMVARGDLGVEIPLERVPIVQKELINKANVSGKTVITATQMLKSMVDNPRPTRAEAADVTNAILDGTDAVMLSEESAIGNYPVRAVETMSRISEQTVNSPVFEELTEKLRSYPPGNDSESLSLASCNLSDNIGASSIIIYTESGATALHISKHRPKQRVLALTPKLSTYRHLTLMWGITPVLVTEHSFAHRNLERTIKKKLKSGLLNKGEKLIITDEQSLRFHQLTG